MTAAGVQSKTERLQRDRSCVGVLKPVSKRLQTTAQSAFGGCRNRNQISRLRDLRCQSRRCRFFQNQVRICSIEGKSADRCPSKMSLFSVPGTQLAIDKKWATSKIDMLIRLVEIKRRGQFPLFHRQQNLDYAGDSRSSEGMANIGFDRTNGAEFFSVRITAKSAGQRLNLDRIA